MGILLNGGINFDIVRRLMMLMIVIGEYGWYFRENSQYLDKRKYATKRINAVVTYRKTSRLIGGRSFRPVYYYVYAFTGLDEYEGVAFYGMWLDVHTEHEIGETVSLLVNEYNLAGKKTIKKLTSGQSYYIRIRAHKTVKAKVKPKLPE